MQTKGERSASSPLWARFSARRGIQHRTEQHRPPIDRFAVQFSPRVVRHDDYAYAKAKERRHENAGTSGRFESHDFNHSRDGASRLTREQA